jgi:hypothetical protein
MTKQITMNEDMEEVLLDEIITYFGAYKNNIPFTYTDEQHQTFIDDICQIIVETFNKNKN